MFYSKSYASPALNAQREDCCVELLNHVPSEFSLVAKKALEAPITEVELNSAIHILAKGKIPGPNGLTTNFFKAYWSFISADFKTMVSESLRQGRFPKGVTCGLIALLLKEGDRLKFTN